MEAQAKPRVLIVYYTFSKQTERVADVIADDARASRGADVTKARIELTDKRWAKRFETVPMRFPLIKIVGMLPAQMRQATGEIQSRQRRTTGDYDLVVDRLADLVVPGEPADALVPQVARRQEGPRPASRSPAIPPPAATGSRTRGHQAVRRGRWRAVGRRDALRGRRQPGPVDARLARLHVRLHLPRSALRLPPDEPPAGFEAQARTSPRASPIRPLRHTGARPDERHVPGSSAVSRPLTRAR